MLSLKINGRTLEVDAEPDTPLLWVLRDQLGLTGTKYGCGIAQCGACTVHVDGAPTRSCQLPVESAVGQRDRHDRGPVGQDGDAVRTAWQQLEVVQCGYCQSGQIMSAAALLAENRKPSDADIDAGHDQHLPLRHLPAHPRRGPPRRQAAGGLSHAADRTLVRPPAAPAASRRRFLVGAAAAGAGLTDRLRRPRRRSRRRGQGARGRRGHAVRGLPADRARRHRHRALGAPRDGPGHLHRRRHAGRRGARRRLEPDARRGRLGQPEALRQPRLGRHVQGTGGSTAIASSCERYRQAGALARACWSRRRPRNGACRRPRSGSRRACCRHPVRQARHHGRAGGRGGADRRGDAGRACSRPTTCRSRTRAISS